jgi:hypothetical protein
VSSAALARYEAAQAVWDLASNKLKMGREDFGGETATADEARFLWSDRLAAASVTAGVLSAVDAYAQHVARMEEHAELTEVLQRGGRRSERDVAAMKYFVADARVQLERVSK